MNNHTAVLANPKDITSKRDPENVFLAAAAGVVAEEALLMEVIQDVLTKLNPLRAHDIKNLLGSNLVFSQMLNRAVLNLAVVMSLAKTLAEEADYESSMILLKEIQFSAFGGTIGMFSKAMVRSDIDESKRNLDEFYVHDGVAPLVLRGRLDKIVTFIEAQQNAASIAK